MGYRLRGQQYGDTVETPMVRAVARVTAGPGRSADLAIDGYAIECEVPVDDTAAASAPTPFGLLAASLSACTAMSARTFLERWEVGPTAVRVEVQARGGPDALVDRHVVVAAPLSVGLREQLAAVVDSTPVTVLLRDSLTIRTRISASA